MSLGNRLIFSGFLTKGKMHFPLGSMKSIVHREEEMLT